MALTTRTRRTATTAEPGQPPKPRGRRRPTTTESADAENAAVPVVTAATTGAGTSGLPGDASGGIPGDLVPTSVAGLDGIAAGSTPVQMIPIDRLDTDPANPDRRRRVEEMADSIREVGGILTPLLVRPYPRHPRPTSAPDLTPGDGPGDGLNAAAGEPGRWIIVEGGRRLAGAQLVGLREVPCIVRDLDEAQAVHVALVSGLQQESLTPIEEARQLQRLMDLRSLTVTDLAKSVARSTWFVSGRLGLLTLPVQAQQALEEGKISITEADGLAELADYPERILELLEDLDEDGLDRYDLEQAIRWAAHQREYERLRADAQARGLRLIETAPRALGYDYVANLDLTPRQVAAHARQSCHSVYLDTVMGTPRLVPVCTNPARHDPKPAPASNTQPGDPTSPGAGGRVSSSGDSTGGSTGSEAGTETEAEQAVREQGERAARARAEQEERERAERERARQRKRVTNARKEFLRSMATKRTPKRSEALLFVLGAMVERCSPADAAWIAGILDLQPTTGRYGENNWRLPLATYAAESGENLLRVCVLISSHWAEEQIHPHAEGYSAFTARYVELLAGFGYEPDPYEVDQINHTQRAVNSTDENGTDDPEDTDDTENAEDAGTIDAAGETGGAGKAVEATTQPRQLTASTDSRPATQDEDNTTAPAAGTSEPAPQDVASTEPDTSEESSDPDESSTRDASGDQVGENPTA